MAVDGDTWLDLGPASYQADGAADPIFFPARMINEVGGLRIAKRARPWQNGEKVDAIGATGDEFSIECLFHNDVAEPGAESQQMWPTAIEALIEQFKSGKTATLHLPWKRNLRVKPAGPGAWDRRANADEHRGGETVTVKLCTDNEDDLDREAFERVTVRAGVQSAVEEAVFDLESIGGWDGSLADITELSANLVGLLNSPGDLGQSVLLAARRLRNATTAVMAALSSNTPGRNQLSGPEGAGARGKLLAILDLTGRAETDALAAQPKTKTVTFKRRRDIWTIATELGQNARDLMGINGSIEDFAVIEPGTPVFVFA